MRWSVWSAALCAVVSTVALVSACNARRGDADRQLSRSEVVPNLSREDSAYHLDLRAPSVHQEVGDDAAATEAKFVAIDVFAVTNPDRLSLSFELRYQAGAGQEQLLGTVSLYPSDNPGKFVVATGGRIRGRGVLVLTLVSPDPGAGRDAIRVSVRRLRFLPADS